MLRGSNFINSLALWRTRLAKLFATTMADDEQWFLPDVIEAVNKGLPGDGLFDVAEATAACTKMHDDEELMLSEGIVYKI